MFVQKHSGRRYPHNAELRAAMGLPKKLPLRGMAPKLVRVCDRMVWFFLLPTFGLKKKTSRHRMWAICPSCALAIPAGRLGQHEGTDACYQQYNRLTVDRDVQIARNVEVCAQLCSR